MLRDLHSPEGYVSTYSLSGFGFVLAAESGAEAEAELFMSATDMIAESMVSCICL